MKVSIIIPVYNIEKYIGKCLDSVISQTHTNLEVIIVDDGSKDNSKDICLEYSNKYQGIIKYYYKHNGGLSYARNYRLDKITGDAVLFLDGDDYISSNCIELLVDNMEKYNSDIVLYSHKSEYKTKTIVHELFGSEYSESKNLMDIVYPRLFGLSDRELDKPLDCERFNTVWGKLYSINVLKDILFLDTKVIGTEDAWFNINVFANCKKITFCKNAYYFYNRNVSTSLTRNYNKFLFSGWKYLYELQHDFIKSNKLDDKFLESLNNRIILNLFGLVANITNSNLTLKDKFLKIREVLDDQIYKDRFVHFRFKNLPTIWRLFYRLSYMKSYIGVYLFIKLAYYFKGN